MRRSMRSRIPLAFGVVEIGVSYEPGCDLDLMRKCLERVAESIQDDWGIKDLLSPVAVDEIATGIDAMLVDVFGNVARFVEVWCGDALGSHAAIRLEVR